MSPHYQRERGCWLYQCPALLIVLVPQGQDGGVRRLDKLVAEDAQIQCSSSLAEQKMISGRSWVDDICVITSKVRSDENMTRSVWRYIAAGSSPAKPATLSRTASRE